MQGFELFQVDCQQVGGDPAQHAMDELVECLAHRKNDENDGEIYDGSCSTCYTQAMLWDGSGFVQMLC